jgi:hypothetical protein
MSVLGSIEMRMQNVFGFNPRTVTANGESAYRIHPTKSDGDTSKLAVYCYVGTRMEARFAFL